MDKKTLSDRFFDALEYPDHIPDGMTVYDIWPLDAQHNYDDEHNDPDVVSRVSVISKKLMEMMDLRPNDFYSFRLENDSHIQVICSDSGSTVIQLWPEVESVKVLASIANNQRFPVKQEERRQKRKFGGLLNRQAPDRG